MAGSNQPPQRPHDEDLGRVQPARGFTKGMHPFELGKPIARRQGPMWRAANSSPKLSFKAEPASSISSGVTGDMACRP